jgi:hypothetical protein
MVGVAERFGFDPDQMRTPRYGDDADCLRRTRAYIGFAILM